MSEQLRPLAPRIEKRRVDGVVLLDKPPGLSSNAALQRVKRAYRAHKAGHTGTLDPLATGLLPICLGEATKFAQRLLDSEKVYLADILLGIETETGDAEGAVVRQRPVSIDRAQIECALEQFRGDIMQVPHKYSAIKREGRALYDYARSDEEVTVEPRPVRITGLRIEAWSSPVVSVHVRCSKGTYIRSLAEDIGRALQCGAHVAALRRVGTGRFAIDAAIDLVRLEAASEAERDTMLMPVTTLIADLPAEMLSRPEAERFMQGLPARGREPEVHGTPDASGLTAVYAEAEDPATGCGFLGLGRREVRDGAALVIPVRLLATNGMRMPHQVVSRLGGV